MIVALVSDGPSLRVQVLAEDGSPFGDPVLLGSPAELGRWDTDTTRWVWDATETVYQPLLATGFRPLRCHDITLTERILLGREGRWSTRCGRSRLRPDARVAGPR